MLLEHFVEELDELVGKEVHVGAGRVEELGVGPDEVDVGLVLVKRRVLARLELLLHRAEVHRVRHNRKVVRKIESNLTTTTTATMIIKKKKNEIIC